MKRVLSLLVLLTLILLSFAMPAAAQNNSSIQIDVNAGFDGHYRGNMWMPLFIRVRNDGDAVSGRLVVRPETSGSVVDNTFSTAIELPSGSRKSTLLYIVPSGFGSQVRVELMSNDGIVLSSANQRIQSMATLDTLYVVVTASAAGSVDLTGVKFSGYDAFQANWNVENIPSYGGGLQAVDLMLFSDIDTGTLTAEQRTAIGDWVADGGHLIVTGGANWQSTAAGFSDLLPMTPTTSATLDGLPELARWTMSGDGTSEDTTVSLADAQAELTAQTLVSVGTVKDGAQVLLASDSTEPPTPLLLRRTYGSGVVDYMTADPNTQPMRGWQGLGGLWYTLMNSRAPLPSWGHNYTDWASAESATQIIPGFNLLPDTFALCSFLALYIALIGPLNYFILNRLNKREYAWFSIPVLIVVFSVVAWVTGFNLRGTDVTLNRMTLIQSWPDVDHAQVDGLVGLLAPRRANYTLSMGDNSMLRTVPPQTSTSPFGGSLAGPDIQQGDIFQAADFPVDASFIAGFNVNGTIPRPDIGGQASLSYDDSTTQSVRGAVSNNSEWTLIEPVILARGTAQRLTNALTPGDTVPFSFPLTAEGQPEPLRVDTTPRNPYYYGTNTYTNTDQTMLQILGDDVYNATNNYYFGFNSYNTTNDPNWQANTRRRAFLTSFLSDYFASTGRGDRVYLVGWVDASPTPLDVDNVSWRSQDLTLFVAELSMDVTPPTGRVMIGPDRFTWSVRERQNINTIGPYNLAIYSDGEIIYRYTPLPDAVLTHVDRLIVHMESGETGTPSVDIQMWNWDDGRWDDVTINSVDKSIPNPARYLGPQNAVEIRIFRQPQDTSLNISAMWIEQRGTFQ